MNGPLKSNPKGHFCGKLPSNSAQINQVVKVLFQVHLKIIHLALDLVMVIVLSVHVSDQFVKLSTGFQRLIVNYLIIAINLINYTNVKPVVVRVANHAIIY